MIARERVRGRGSSCMRRQWKAKGRNFSFLFFSAQVQQLRQGVSLFLVDEDLLMRLVCQKSLVRGEFIIP